MARTDEKRSGSGLWRVEEELTATTEVHCRDEKAGLAVMLEEVTPRKPYLGTDSDRRHNLT